MESLLHVIFMYGWDIHINVYVYVLLRVLMNMSMYIYMYVYIYMSCWELWYSDVSKSVYTYYLKIWCIDAHTSQLTHHDSRLIVDVKPCLVD